MLCLINAWLTRKTKIFDELREFSFKFTTDYNKYDEIIFLVRTLLCVAVCARISQNRSFELFAVGDCCSVVKTRELKLKHQVCVDCKMNQRKIAQLKNRQQNCMQSGAGEGRWIPRVQCCPAASQRSAPTQRKRFSHFWICVTTFASRTARISPTHQSQPISRQNEGWR